MIDGYEPGQDGFTLTAGNRQAVKNWLIAEGIDPVRVEGMRPSSLEKAYRYPAYLQSMKQRADYYPPLRGREATGCGEAAEREDKPCQPSLKDTTISRPMKAPSISPSPDTCLRSELSTTSEDGQFSVTSPVPTMARLVGSDPIEVLASALRCALAVQPLTEARVLELIYEHAPKAIKESLK